MQVDVNKIDNDNPTGNDRPLAGLYHWGISNVVENAAKMQVEISMKVLAGAPDGQEGRVHIEYMKVDNEVGLKKLNKLTNAVHFTSDQWFRDLKAKGIANPDIPYVQIVGRQFCASLEEEEYTKDGIKKTTMRLGGKAWTICAVDSPDAIQFKLNSGALNRFNEDKKNGLYRLADIGAMAGAGGGAAGGNPFGL